VPTWKSVESVVIPGAPVFTCPVGPLVMLGFGGALPWFATPTVNSVPELVGGCAVLTRWTVVAPDPLKLAAWSEIQKGLVVEKESPQAPCKFGSVCCAVARLWLLVTRFVWT